MTRLSAQASLKSAGAAEFGAAGGGHQARVSIAPPSPLRSLFAARQVYVRSGGTSRYVVVSRALQLGVVAALVLATGWLVTASYGALAKHLETVEQQSELTRLEGVNRSLRAAAEAARANEALRTAADRVPFLTAALDDAKVARARALDLVQAASGETVELRRELDLAEERIAELKDALQTAEGGPYVTAVLSDRYPFDPPGEAPPPQETANDPVEDPALATTPEGQLRVLRTERDELRRLLIERAAEAEERGAEAAALRVELADAATVVAQLRHDLATSRADVELALAKAGQCDITDELLPASSSAQP